MRTKDEPGNPEATPPRLVCIRISQIRPNSATPTKPEAVKLEAGSAKSENGVMLERKSGNLETKDFKNSDDDVKKVVVDSNNGVGSGTDVKSNVGCVNDVEHMGNVVDVEQVSGVENVFGFTDAENIISNATDSKSNVSIVNNGIDAESNVGKLTDAENSLGNGSDVESSVGSVTDAENKENDEKNLEIDLYNRQVSIL